MLDHQCTGVAGSSDQWAAFMFDEIIANDNDAIARWRRYAPPPSPALENVREPRKNYGKSRKKSANAPGSGTAYQQDIFTRLDRLRAGAKKDSIEEQLERLQAIAALMQSPDQGPMPGEMLRVYAWEVEDAVEIIKKNSGVGIQNKAFTTETRRKKRTGGKIKTGKNSV